MAKRLIVGSALTQYKDKASGVLKKMLSLHCAGNSLKVFGKTTEEIIINEDSPLYEMIFNSFDKASEMVGFMVEIDRDKKGYIENFEILEKSDENVIWGF
jgi:thiamine kinase-like enzyme